MYRSGWGVVSTSNPSIFLVEFFFIDGIPFLAHVQHSSVHMSLLGRELHDTALHRGCPLSSWSNSFQTQGGQFLRLPSQDVNVHLWDFWSPL